MESTESQQQQSLSAVDPEKKHLIEQNISTLQSKITQLCNEFGRPLDPPLLIAVTKKVPIMEIKVAYDAGLKHFAENYVQDLEQKINQFPLDICWHFIGHLQSNKIKQLARLRTLYMIQTLDSLEKAIELDFYRKSMPKLRVMIQVNTSQESTKHGLVPEEALKVAQFIVENCWNLRFKGFMTIGSLENSTNSTDNPDFRCLNDLRDKAMQFLPERVGKSLRLSMGMTNDYQTAIKMKSNYLRIGTGIFGERQ